MICSLKDDIELRVDVHFLHLGDREDDILDDHLTIGVERAGKECCTVSKKQCEGNMGKSSKGFDLILDVHGDVDKGTEKVVEELNNKCEDIMSVPLCCSPQGW